MIPGGLNVDNEEAGKVRGLIVEMLRRQYLYNNRLNNFGELEAMSREILDRGSWMDFDRSVDSTNDLYSYADVTAEILNKNLEVYEYEGVPSRRKLQLTRVYKASSGQPNGVARVLYNPRTKHFDILAERPYPL